MHACSPSSRCIFDAWLPTAALSQLWARGGRAGGAGVGAGGAGEGIGLQAAGARGASMWHAGRVTRGALVVVGEAAGREGLRPIGASLARSRLMQPDSLGSRQLLDSSPSSTAINGACTRPSGR